MKRIRTGCPGIKNSMTKDECNNLIDTFDRSKFSIFSVIIELAHVYKTAKRDVNPNFFRGSKLR